MQLLIYLTEETQLNNAIFTQIDKKIGDRINISLGARYEQFKLKTSEPYFISGDSITFFSCKTCFRAGINYQLAKGTFLRSSLGQGYRFSIAELFIETEVARYLCLSKS